ncbi:hypothetical protein RN001_015213 [Aquatica leii]|uniref:Retinol dehydrogenase 11 n=1 Tax=Aquatica leii TaxID=1421715 RepID=A0AAN7PPD2_9COLE|nr:hypothetical protein RN001_015213 [Aquatica leii]
MNSLTSYVLIPAVFLLLCLRKYKEHTWGKCLNKIKLDGKVAIVTGANSGIGYEITKELASRGAQVIMACRDLNKAAKAMYQIKQEIQSPVLLIPMELDLRSIESIKTFCNEITSAFVEIHILVNNAGVSFPKNMELTTKDGLEIHYGVNYLGHFVLTNLLLSPLLNAESSRIIVISSTLHERGTLDNVGAKTTDNYANSKLANLYFCKELASRLHGTNVKVMTVCPGWTNTNLFRHHTLKWYQIILIVPVAFFFMRTAKQGSETVIFCATQPNVQSGCIYKDCRKYKSRIDFDIEMSNKLWFDTKQIVEQIDEHLRLGILFKAPF